MAIPIIDERIKHIGPGTVRKMDALKLRALRDLLVIQVNDEPLAVMIPYEMYLEMQKEAAKGEAALASKTAEFEEAFGSLSGINYDGQPNGGTDHNPAMKYSKDSYIEPARERRQVPRSGSTVDMPQHEPKSDIAKDMVEPLPGPHPPVRGIPYIIESEPEWFQGKSRTVVDQKDSGWVPPDLPRCDHCGKPGAALCPECFVAGHRAVANCQQCAERSV